MTLIEELKAKIKELRELQQINYPILWGGLKRPPSS